MAASSGWRDYFTPSADHHHQHAARGRADRGGAPLSPAWRGPARARPALALIAAAPPWSVRSRPAGRRAPAARTRPRPVTFRTTSAHARNGLQIVVVRQKTAASRPPAVCGPARADRRKQASPKWLRRCSIRHHDAQRRRNRRHLDKWAAGSAPVPAPTVVTQHDPRQRKLRRDTAPSHGIRAASRRGARAAARAALRAEGEYQAPDYVSGAVVERRYSASISTAIAQGPGVGRFTRRPDRVPSGGISRTTR